MRIAPAWTLLTVLATPCLAQDEVATALHRWHDAFVGRKIELGEPAYTGSKAKNIYGELIADPPLSLTHLSGLQTILDLAIENQSPDVAREGLRLAAVGLGHKRVDITRRPEVVRASALGALGHFSKMAALEVVMQTARGETKGWRRSEWHVAIQAAALRALGAIDVSVARPLIQKQLHATDPEVRLASADALHAIASPRALLAIATAIESERNSRVATILAKAAHQTLGRNVDRCSTSDIRRVVKAACGMLGRTDWRADLAAVNLLADFRNVTAVEPMIAILERFHEKPEDVDKGLISGLLRHRTHEVLQELTGARMPAHEPEQWRAWWERVRGEFVLAKQPEKVKGNTSSGFFGIPIIGARIVFIIDRSGSMIEQYRGNGDGGDGGTRFEYARRELLRAVSKLPPDTRFNVVTFSDTVKAWRKGFADSAKPNQSALKTKLKSTKVQGGTNIFGALEKALGLKTAAYGKRYASAVDEIFLLSDGAPTVGEITDPGGILSVVREANEHRNVRINTIFIGSEDRSGFMRNLAKQNDGQFVRL